MVKTQNIDTALLEEAIDKSGLKEGFITEQIGITRQAFYKKKKGQCAFRQSEVYVLCDLLKLNDEEKNHIFFP